MRWRKVTLVGVGLLGGSLGLALRRRGLADEVTGFVRRSSAVEEAKAAGAVDHATTDLHSAVAGADLIVLCTPLWQMGKLAREFVSSIEKGAIATDVGSVKGALVADLENLFGSTGAFFVGSHPMAGSERMGVKAARADLFENACCVVTPTPQSDLAAVGRVEWLWTGVGAKVLQLDPDLHDQIVARSSHLPHVLAANLASFVLAPGFPEQQRQLCAGGFKDSTRIASGSPEMWRDIVMMNREHVGKTLEEFGRGLIEFAQMLERNDAAEIEAFFRIAKSRRDSWVSECVPKTTE